MAKYTCYNCGKTLIEGKDVFWKVLLTETKTSTNFFETQAFCSRECLHDGIPILKKED